MNKHHPLSAAKGQNPDKSVGVSVSKSGADDTRCLWVVANPEKDELSVFWLCDWDWHKHTGHWARKHTLQTNSKCKTTVLLQYTGVLSSAAPIACQAHQHMRGWGAEGCKGGNRLAPKNYHEVCCMRCVEKKNGDLLGAHLESGGLNACPEFTCLQPF